MEECKLYISELIIPDGYEVELIGITGAKSMTAGCNEGMQKSDAKYKVYMHQDVFITNKHFLSDLLTLFHKDAQIGMIGTVGTPFMAKNGTMWSGVRFGGLYKLHEYVEKGTVKLFHPFETGYMEVEAVDGLLMATQYDIPWREDLFQKWDFYDVSQSFEFLKAGYKVVVPGQKEQWCIHDCGAINLEKYDGEREIFLANYAEYMKDRQDMTSDEYIEKVKMCLREGFYGEETEKQRLLDLVDTLEKEL